jgi:Zn finger protein HypA/HybF involved in hydrogenase expression
MAKNSLANRQRTTHMTSMANDAAMEAVEHQRKDRMCLSCRSMFDSAWSGERVCPRCKGTSAWRTGSIERFHKYQ